MAKNTDFGAIINLRTLKGIAEDILKIEQGGKINF
jgi:hypothetical protein